MSIANPTIAVIGAGNMGSALIAGLIANQHPPEQYLEQLSDHLQKI